MQKKAYPIGKPDFPQRKTKDVAKFFVSKWRLSCNEIFAYENQWKKWKNQAFYKNRHSVLSSSTLFVGVKIVRQLFLLFSFFWLTLLVFLDVLSLFHVVPYRNLTVWFFICCHFCVISILFVSCWGPMEATFSSWILSSGLNCARELRASNVKHRDCCSHHLPTWFVEGNISQQLDSRLLSFWLVSWGGPKLKIFAVNVEQQRRKLYRRIFAEIVAIRSPPLFL